MGDYRNPHHKREHFLNIHGDATFAVGLTIEQFGSTAHIALGAADAEKLAAEIMEYVTESRVDKADRRKDLRCSFCPPNRKENAKRKARPKKPGKR